MQFKTIYAINVHFYKTGTPVTNPDDKMTGMFHFCQLTV